MKLVFIVAGFFASIFCSSVYGGFPASFGPGDLDGRNGFTIGSSGGRYLGRSASNAGDINGDGISDFIISGLTSEIYVFFGYEGPWPVRFDPSDLNGDNGFRIVGVPEDIKLVWVSVSSAGDVNGDNIDDFIVALVMIESGHSFCEAYVIFGSKERWPVEFDITNLNGNNGFMIARTYLDGGIFDGRIHFSMSGLGDFNGDGIDDFMVGALFTTESSPSGQSCVVFGRKVWPSKIRLADLNGEDGFVIDAGYPDNFDFSGSYVRGPGDINRDGIPDALIGSYFSEGYGRSYALYGGKGPWPLKFNISNLNGKNGFAIRDNELKSRYGNLVSGAGDFDSDGINDIMVGSYFGHRGYLLRGREGERPSEINLDYLNKTEGFVMNVTCPEGNCGTQVSWLGDVNGDEKDDVIIGSPFGGDNEAGQSYVLYGNKGPWYSVVNLNKVNGTNGFIFNCKNPKGRCGQVVSGIGDINNDGINDFLISAPYAQNNTGECYVIFGRNGALEP